MNNRQTGRNRLELKLFIDKASLTWACFQGQSEQQQQQAFWLCSKKVNAAL